MKSSLSCQTPHDDPYQSQHKVFLFKDHGYLTKNDTAIPLLMYMTDGMLNFIREKCALAYKTHHSAHCARARSSSSLSSTLTLQNELAMPQHITLDIRSNLIIRVQVRTHTASTRGGADRRAATSSLFQQPYSNAIAGRRTTQSPAPI